MALPRHHRALVLTAGLLTATGLLSSSCGGTSPTARLDRNGIPAGAVSARWIARQPLAHLYYPGSRPFYSLDSGSDERRGSDPAYAGAILASSATGAQIYSWYIRTLKSMGWTFVTDNGCADIQPSCPQFGHDRHGQREAFFLAIDDPRLLPSVIGKTAPPACTVYEMSYEIYPPGGIRVPAPMRFSGGSHCWWTGTSWRKPPDVP